MTGIPAHALCQIHRAWEAIFIVETCIAIQRQGIGIIRERKLEGRFDLRLVRRRMKEIRTLDSWPNGIIVDTAIRFPKVTRHASQFLGYVHPTRHINHLRRVCAECRLLIDNDARARGHLHLPAYIKRVL